MNLRIGKARVIASRDRVRAAGLPTKMHMQPRESWPDTAQASVSPIQSHDSISEIV